MNLSLVEIQSEEKIQNGNLSGTELEKRENPSVPDSDEKEFTEEYYGI